MVKTPNVRHSKSRKEPVTIDLEASRLPSDETDAATHEAAESPPLTEASEAALDETGKDAADASERDTAADFSERQPAQPETSSTEVPPTATEGAAEPRDAATSQYGRQDTGSETRRPGATNTPPPPSGRGGLSSIAAGIIGGIVTLVGAGALQYGGVLPSLGGGGSDAVAVERLRAEIAGLQTEIGALKSGSDASGVGQTVADLQTRVETLTAGLDTVRQAVEAGGAGENAGVAALDSKIAELQAEIARLGQGAGAQPVDLAPLNDRITSLETGVKSAADAVVAIDPRLTALEQGVAALTGKVDAQGNQPKIALSIAASALKAAIDRGQSFAAELDTLAAISPNLPQLAALRANAEAGVAAREDLDAEMDSAAKAMIAADRPADANASYVDQLWESAASLVTVRPVGAVAGAGVPETVARIEAALKAGDLAKALTEYDSLPEPAKAAGAAFAGKIKARLDVETLVDQAIAEAMKSV